MTNLTPKNLTPEITLADRHKFEKVAAKALAGLAHVLMIDYLRGWNDATEENIRLAEKILEKVYTLHQSVALAHVTEGKIREARGDLLGEIDALKEALALDPDLADAYAHQANALILLGQADKALDVLTKAMKRVGGNPEPGLFSWFMGRAYFSLTKYPEAIQWLEKSVAERPTTWFSQAHLISAYFLQGPPESDKAQAAVNEYRKKFGADWPLDPNIRNYYKQPKYRSAPRQFQDVLDKYFDGLEIAKKKAEFP